MTKKPGLDETVKLQAAQWLARQRSDRRTEEDSHRFQAWLAENPAHGEAFEALTAVWDVAGNYPHDMRAGRRTAATAPGSRRTVIAGLLAAPVVGTAAYLALPRPAQASTYVTRIGEQRAIALPDDSRALLDTNSCLDVVFDRDTRLVTLRYGRANFTVVADQGRPFIVTMTEGKVIAGASNFDIRCEGGNACVMLFSGQASLDLNAELHHMTPGERIALTGGSVRAVERPHPATAGAWHSGRTVFEDARLADAVAEMNRYSTMGLEIQGGDLGNKRISGVYRNGDSIAFADTVAVLTGAKVRQTRDRVLLLSNDGLPLTKAADQSR